MLYEKGEDLTELQRIVREAAVEKWGEDINIKSIKTPFRDQGEKDFAGDVDGATFAAAYSGESNRPAVVDENVDPILDPGEFYPGCYARAKIHAYAWEHKKSGKGVSFGLGNIQKVGDGERLGGRPQTDPKDDFDPVADRSADRMADMMG
jgi:hypothetical protein